MFNIILEGPDGSGKSTLAKKLAHELVMKVQHSGGPAKGPHDMELRLRRFAKMDYTVFDRHPCISEPIYGSYRQRLLDVNQQQIEHFYSQGHLIIYCDGTSQTRTNHVTKGHETGEHQELLNNHGFEIIDRYRSWAINRADLVYRIGENEDKVIQACKAYMDRFPDPLQDVENFHRKFGFAYEGKPRSLPDEVTIDRQKFDAEENGEYLRAMDRIRSEEIKAWEEEYSKDRGEIIYQMDKMLDGLVDRLYVLMGTIQLHGFSSRVFWEAWYRVHRANMSKELMRGGDSHKWGVGKPQGWIAPDHSDLVEDNAHVS